MRIFRMLLLIIPTLALAGCAPSLTNGKGENPIPLASITPPANESVPNPLPILPTQGGNTPMSPAIIPSDPGLQSLIDKAIADLAERIFIPTDQITLVEATAVVWPDSSLGCPEEGMLYTQVLTPGYLIHLEYDGSGFEYHADKENTITTCENPSSPVPGMPGDQ